MLLKIVFFLPTYIVVASSWVSHYRILTYLKRSSSLFIILNILFLASIVFLPVPVLFFYQYGNQSEVWQVFAITQMVTSTTLLCMWIVARVDHLLDPEIPSEYLRYTTARLFVIPIGILLSIGVAFYNVWIAEGIFLAFYVLGWFLHNLYYHRNRRAIYLEGYHPHVLDFRQYDCGGDYLLDCNNNEYSPVQQSAIFFDSAERGIAAIACVQLFLFDRGFLLALPPSYLHAHQAP